LLGQSLRSFPRKTSATIQGFFRKFFYIRGSAFSFLIDENNYFEKYTKKWQDIVKQKIINPINNKITQNYGGETMITITDGTWIADLGSMTCRNLENRITVTFRRRGKTFEGKLDDMPVELWKAGRLCQMGSSISKGR
jgi:hypothetical protein